MHYLNIRAYAVSDLHVDLTKSAEWLAQQDSWMRAMIDSHPSEEDAFWRHVSYITAQFDGVQAGYVSAAMPDWVNGDI